MRQIPRRSLSTFSESWARKDDDSLKVKAEDYSESWSSSELARRE